MIILCEDTNKKLFKKIIMVVICGKIGYLRVPKEKSG